MWYVLVNRLRAVADEGSEVVALAVFVDSRLTQEKFTPSSSDIF
jgi:hypothetical protein